MGKEKFIMEKLFSLNNSKRMFLEMFKLALANSIMLINISVFLLGIISLFNIDLFNIEIDEIIINKFNTSDVIFALLISPVIEEFLFRELLLKELANKFGVKVGLIISSIIFGIIHPGAVKFFGTIAGLILGTTLLKYNILKTCILLHSSMNLLNILYHNLLSEYYLNLLIKHPILIVIISFVLFIIASIYIWNYIVYNLKRVRL